jgi:hypothetical protein
MDFQEQIAVKTDQELLDIYINPEQYQEAFVNQSRQELMRRGVSLDKYENERATQILLKTEQFQEGRSGNDLYIGLGFVSAVLGGLIGIYAGYVYSQSKHRGPTGKEYYVYNKETRDKGRIMLIIGVFAFLIITTWQLS